jgi:2-polyprenyl-6-methoxyphenol hydroxylase-like FAD-dependent oxidoreductase
MMVASTGIYPMRYTDIAVIGGGLAGSTAAAMLGRAGIAAIPIDPHPSYPSDFRVEKLSGEAQVERFRKTGIAESVLRSARYDGENWIASCGYLLDKKPRTLSSTPSGPRFRLTSNRSSPRPCRFRPGQAGLRRLVGGEGL